MGSASNIILLNKKYDIDAEIYINAVQNAGGVINSAQRVAVNTLFRNLKGRGPNNGISIWSNIDRLWPILGGTANSVKLDIRLNEFIFTGSGHIISPTIVKTNGSSNAINTQRTDLQLGTNPGMGYMVSSYIAANGSSGAVDAAYTSRVAIQKIFGGTSYRNSALSNESSIDTTATSTTYIHTIRAVGETTGIRDFTNTLESPLKTAPITTQINTPIHFGGLWQSNGVMGAWDEENFTSMWLTTNMTINQAIALRNCLLAFKTSLSK